MATFVDGKALAASVRVGLAERVRLLKTQDIHPCIAVILVGDDVASQIYVRGKIRACEETGIVHQAHQLPDNTTEAALLGLITQLNHDATVHAILVQLPLPPHISKKNILDAVHPDKDVDGFHSLNTGRLALGLPGIRPCTPLGIMEILRHHNIPIAGAHAVVVGRSRIVGRPAAFLLMAADATVTLCNKATKNLRAHIERADILVAAVGKPHFIPGDWIKPGAVVIDVGITRLPDGTLHGDIDTATAATRASLITPVPGGVGPMTIAMLLQNTVELASRES